MGRFQKDARNYLLTKDIEYTVDLAEVGSKWNDKFSLSYAKIRLMRNEMKGLYGCIRNFDCIIYNLYDCIENFDLSIPSPTLCPLRHTGWAKICDE